MITLGQIEYDNNKKMITLTGLYVCVLVLEVGGGVLTSDETDRVWSEALFALTCCSSNQ